MGLQACITKNRQPETEFRKLPGWVTGPPWAYMSLTDLFGGVPAGCGELVRLLIVDCFESERALWIPDQTSPPYASWWCVILSCRTTESRRL